MSITYPIDLLPTFPGWTIGFSLRYRQEQSTQASGRVIVKDMGAPLWTLRAMSKMLSPNRLDQWRAELNKLENGLQTFKAYPMSRCYPQAYPNGSWYTGAGFGGIAALASIHTNRKAISLSGLPAGFVLSVGDYISIGGDLHQVMEAATADGTPTLPEPVNTVLPVVSGTPEVGQTLTVTNGTWSGNPPMTFSYQWVRTLATELADETSSAQPRGTTAQFEVRPHIWPARTVGTAVSLKQPNCQMAIVPGSITSEAQLNGWGSISFSAMEARL